MAPTSECVQNCTFIKDYVGLMTDWAHICFELSLEFITGVLLYPIVRRLVRAYRLRIHQEIDAEHGVVHSEQGVAHKEG